MPPAWKTQLTMSTRTGLLLAAILIDACGLVFLALYRIAPWTDLPAPVATRLRRRRRIVPWVLIITNLVTVAGLLSH
jgi:hypothetical protein